MSRRFAETSPVAVRQGDTSSFNILRKIGVLVLGCLATHGTLFCAPRHTQDKPITANGSLVAPGPNGGLIYTNSTSEVTFPLPLGWKVAKNQKQDQALLQNASNTCRLLLGRIAGNHGTAEHFENNLHKQFVKDGNVATPIDMTKLGTAPAPHLQVTFHDGVVEQVYSTKANGSIYVMILVSKQGCNDDFGATLSGFRP